MVVATAKTINYLAQDSKTQKCTNILRKICEICILRKMRIIMYISIIRGCADGPKKHSV